MKIFGPTQAVLIPGCATFLISLIAIIGWSTNTLELVRVLPHWAPMVLNTAVCLLLAALSIISYQFFNSTISKKTLILSGIVILFLSSAVAFQTLFDVDLLIDWTDLHKNSMTPDHVFPGRMAASTSLALTLLGIVLIVIGYDLLSHRLKNIVVKFLSSIVIMIGITGIVGYWLSFEYLYTWTGQLSMSVLTAISLLFVGTASFNLSARFENKNALSDLQNVRKVYLITIIVLLFISLLSAVSAFSIMAHRTEQIITEKLLQLHKDRSFFFNVAISARSERALVASKDRDLLEILKKLNQNPGDKKALRELFELMLPLADHGFSTISFEGKDETVWKVIENPVDGNLIKIPFGGGYSGELAWQSGFWLITKIPLHDANGEYVGSMKTQQALNSLNKLRESIIEINSSSDMLVCGNAEDYLHCFPSAKEKTPFKIEKFYKGERLPMSYALDLVQSGIRTTFDYKGNKVLAAYGPIANTGLGMVIKIDVDEIYAPIRQQIIKTAGILILLIGIGIFFIRRHIHPILESISINKKIAVDEKEKFIAAVEGGFDAFFIFDAIRNPSGDIVDFRCVFVNEVGAELISRTPNQFTGKLLCEELPCARESVYFDTLKSVVESGVPFQDELYVDHPEVSARWIVRQIIKLGDGIAVTARDITSKKQIEIALKEAERLHSAIVDSASYSIIATARDGTIISVNKAAQRMLWYDEADLVGKTPVIIHDKDEVVIRARELSNQLGRTINPGFEVFIAEADDDLPSEREWTYVRKDGSRFPVKLSVTELRDYDRSIVGYLGIAYDISEQKRAEEYIRHIALHDVLTGLPNRALFDDRVKVAIETAKRDKQKVAIALLDLDHFKHVNDSLGHHIGDKLLEEVSSRLIASVRPSDTIARMGGDEFAFVLPNISHPQGTALVLDKVINAFKPIVHAANYELHITCSIGACVYPDDGADLSTLLRNADTAMYRAKELGRNNFQIFDHDMEQKASKRLKLEHDLRNALENEAFELFYQPQMDLKTRQIIGVEALLRWQKTPGAFVSPLEFIPVAEDSGLIVPIGEWVIKKACEQAAIFRSELHRSLRVAVNISPVQFRHKNLLACIMQAISSSGISTSDFEIEITESAVMDNLENTQSTLGQLRLAGINVALDDFGTGYSSLSYLNRFPINRIKIDQSFVRNVVSSEQDASLAKVIVSMAKSLKIPALAEGVETDEQYKFIEDTGCDEAQGYFIARPMPAAEVIRLCNLAQTNERMM